MPGVVPIGNWIRFNYLCSDDESCVRGVMNGGGESRSAWEGWLEKVENAGLGTLTLQKKASNRRMATPLAACSDGADHRPRGTQRPCRDRVVPRTGNPASPSREQGASDPSRKLWKSVIST